MNTKYLEEQIIAFVRAFGLHKNGETPCGKPISVAEAYVLMELARDGQMSQLALVERLNLVKSTVSRLVQQMVQRGWIKRERSLEDGRVWLCQLTPAGQKIARDVAEARSRKFEGIIAQIPEDSQGNVLKSLTILVEAIRGTNNK
ncbi:MAG: DNA-binding MarR family transcriptional regulator [Candidatus Promineifilaceae bacterium]|jgi:DNA-binding MarR family transcriptional regulator